MCKNVAYKLKNWCVCVSVCVWGGMMETGSQFANIKEMHCESLSGLSFNEFKLASNNTLVYDIPWV